MCSVSCQIHSWTDNPSDNFGIINPCSTQRHEFLVAFLQRTMATGFLLRWKAIAGAVARNARCLKTFAADQPKQSNKCTYHLPTINGRVMKSHEESTSWHMLQVQICCLSRCATQALLVLAVVSSSLAATAPPAVLNSKSSELPHGRNGRKFYKVQLFSFFLHTEFGAATIISHIFMRGSHCHG